MRLASQGIGNDPVIERIILLLTKQGRTQQELCEHLGINRASFTKWKYGRSQSYMARIEIIAEYLGVSKTYLLNCANEEVSIDNLTSVEIDMIRQFRQMGGESQAWLTRAMKYVLKAEENELNKNNN